MADKIGMIRGRECYLKYIKEFFKNDSGVNVLGLNTDTGVITVEVNDIDRCAYLSSVLGGAKPNWDAELFVWVKPSDNARSRSWDVDNVWKIILGDSDLVDRIIQVPGDLGTKVDVIVFKPVLFQIPVDDAFNPDNGIVTYTAEQLAENIFNVILPGGTKFTTAAIKKDEPKKQKRFGRR